MFSILAGVMELVDMLDLGSSAARRGGSTPFTRTRNLDFLYDILLSIKISVILQSINFVIDENYSKKAKRFNITIRH